MNFVLGRLERFDRFLVKYFFPEKYKDELFGDMFNKFSPIIDIMLFSIIVFVFVNDPVLLSWDRLSVLLGVLYGLFYLSPLFFFKELSFKLLIKFRLKYGNWKALFYWSLCALVMLLFLKFVW
ncbi:hypothetical protein [Bacillus paranthracis]|uniref:hypothetical protein n=1 Tax=Bacillus paranthracis TaxID=2026186 RepID=UPI001261C39D|nr:hypothetical protein [Bacillus paranthracis]KAB7631051.1 hypothetical protein GBN96_27855 [Bacillus sp. B4-WWTP-NA-D-NA-NA]MED1077684.1 hypothetical protein [Bacillus paranthracis]